MNEKYLNKWLVFTNKTNLSKQWLYILKIKEDEDYPNELYVMNCFSIKSDYKIHSISKKITKNNLETLEEVGNKNEIEKLNIELIKIIFYYSKM